MLFSPHFFMKNEMPNQEDGQVNDKLYPEDQARVDAFVKRGVNSVERKPFRPLRLLFILMALVISLSVLSQFLARWAGIY